MGVQTLISQSDAELLAGIREDAEAFAVFYERWEAPILAWLVRRVREPELAADLSGEIFAAALSAAARFKAVDETGSAGPPPGCLRSRGTRCGQAFAADESRYALAAGWSHGRRSQWTTSILRRSPPLTGYGQDKAEKSIGAAERR